ncbi:MAG: TonB-dependent receptor, partial [Candidatus Acidiferrales bacterium]
YAPFHSNNMSASLGGPLIPHHQFFFFGSVEPLWSSASTGDSLTTFEDPALTNWAQTNFPDTFGTKLLTSYPASGATRTGVSQTATDLFPDTCGTATTRFLPCNLPMIDTGVFNATTYRNGLQWNFRIDKYFKNDRIYENFYRTTLDYGGPSVRPAFKTTNNTYQQAIQINETHTFSPTTLNEAMFGLNRIEGIAPATGLFSVPVVNVTGMGEGFGSGFATGDFIQHNYHWRDVLTHIQGPHTLKFGYEGWFGDDINNFQGPHAQPTFNYNNLLDLVEDHPFTETGVAYDTITGKPVLFDWDTASSTNGLFAQDVWQVKPNLTLTMGIRWDDFGNPYSRSPSTVFGNFHYGAGLTTQQQISNGFVRQGKYVFNRSQTGFQPRFGVAWNPDKKGVWVLRGGFGLYNNWVTPANAQEEFRGNSPGPIFATFYSDRPGTPPPLLSLGTNNTTPPFGYQYPVISGFTLDSHGGIVGLSPNIGAIDPNLTEPIVYIYSATVQRKLGKSLVAGISYSGSQGRSLLAGGGQEFATNYGQDINAFTGDLIQNNQLTPARLNHSFGEISYTANNRVSSYNSVVASLQGRFGHAFFNASYAHSSSKDDTQIYPAETDPHVYFGPSIWDAPNRFSLTWNFTLPGLNQGHGFLGRVTGGWSISGTSILQTGYPFMVHTTAPFSPTVGADGTFTGYAPGSGDYNADGDNSDFPDVTSYTEQMTRQAFLSGVFTPGQFKQPAFGTEGNEKPYQFRSPRFIETDAALLKDTNITERVHLELRFEFYNIFNHPNLQAIDANLPDATFGRSTGQDLPRWIQFGADLRF